MTKTRIVSALLAAVLALGAVSGLASCAKLKKTAEPPKEKRTNVYAAEDIPLPSDVNYVGSLILGDNVVYMTYDAESTILYNDMGEEVEKTPGYDWQEIEKKEADLPEGWWYSYSSDQMLLKMDLETRETSTAPFSYDEETYGYAYGFVAGPDGTLMTRSQKWDYNEETGESSNASYLLTIDPATSEVTDIVDLTKAMKDAGLDPDNSYINQFLVKGDTLYLATENDVLLFDRTGKYKSKLDLNINGADGWIQGLWSAGERLVFSYYSNGKQLFKIVENGQVTDLKSDALMTGGNSPVAADENNLYFTSSTGVSAYNFANDTYGEVLNWINSDIANNGTVNFLPDGRAVMATTDWSDGKNTSTLSILTRIPDEELEEEIILRLGCVYVDYNLRRAVIDYNKQNTGIRVTMVDYSGYNNEDNEWKGAVTQFNNDIATGNVPDIVLLTTEMPVESYLRKNTFVDLTKYMDDPEKGIDRSKFLTNIWDASMTNGKLNSLIYTFNLNTLLARADIVGTEPGWTFEEMMQTINSLPEDCKAFYEYSRDNILDNFFSYSMSSFINWEKGETYFDTPGFIAFADYLKTCPEKGYWETRYPENYEYDPEIEKEYEQEYSLRFRDKKALFQMGNWSSFTDYLYTRNTFGLKDVTAIGYPREGEGNGCAVIPSIELAIATKSAAKDQAWEVLKYLLTAKYVVNSGYQYSVSRAAMDEMYAKAKEDYGDYMPTEDDFNWMVEEGYSDEYIDFMKSSRQPYDQAAVDYVKTLVESANSIARTDPDLVEIVKEELSAVFAGSKSAETAAKQIASRVGIYVSEHS